MTIIEVVLFNLLPAPVAAPVVSMIKDIVPMLGIALIRVSLYIAIWFQKLNVQMSQKLEQAKLFKMDNVVRMDHLKKLRA